MMSFCFFHSGSPETAGSLHRWEQISQLGQGGQQEAALRRPFGVFLDWNQLGSGRRTWWVSSSGSTTGKTEGEESGGAATLPSHLRPDATCEPAQPCKKTFSMQWGQESSVTLEKPAYVTLSAIHADFPTSCPLTVPCSLMLVIGSIHLIFILIP